jgi:calcium/calmodulin-dependent protein kinase I
VRRAIHRKSKREVAVKICDRSKMTEKDIHNFEAEADLMLKLSHPNIVCCLDFFANEPDTLFLVLEFLPHGDLFAKLIKCQTFNEKEARDAIKAILSGLKYMHDQNIAHRDLKPENLLLSSDDGNFSGIKIADFGFSKQTSASNMMETRLGTPSYVAPEIIQGTPYTKAVDMWSMGVIMYVMLGGYTPFQHNDQRALFRKIKHGKYQFHPKYWDNVSSEAKDLISGMLQLDPAERLTADQALDHPWVSVTTLSACMFGLSSIALHELTCLYLLVACVRCVTHRAVCNGADDAVD